MELMTKQRKIENLQSNTLTNDPNEAQNLQITKKHEIQSKMQRKTQNKEQYNNIITREHNKNIIESGTRLESKAHFLVRAI